MESIILNGIFDILRQKSMFTIDRCRFGGSLEKETATILKVDVDMVAFVNPNKNNVNLNDADSVMQFLENVREHWLSLIMLHPELKINYNLVLGKNAIKINLGGFDFDLCPAINHSPNPKDELTIPVDKRKVSRIPVDQDEVDPIGYVCAVSCIPVDPACSETLAFLKELKASVGPTSSEAAIQFLKEHSPYVKALCRLAKFWQCSVPFLGYKSGRSFLFEIIAVRYENGII